MTNKSLFQLIFFFKEFSDFPYSVVYMKQNLMQKMTKTLLLLIFMEKLMSHFFFHS